MTRTPILSPFCSRKSRGQISETTVRSSRCTFRAQITFVRSRFLLFPPSLWARDCAVDGSAEGAEMVGGEAGRNVLLSHRFWEGKKGCFLNGLPYMHPPAPFPLLRKKRKKEVASIVSAHSLHRCRSLSLIG